MEPPKMGHPRPANLGTKWHLKCNPGHESKWVRGRGMRLEKLTKTTGLVKDRHQSSAIMARIGPRSYPRLQRTKDSTTSYKFEDIVEKLHTGGDWKSTSHRTGAATLCGLVSNTKYCRANSRTLHLWCGKPPSHLNPAQSRVFRCQLWGICPWQQRLRPSFQQFVQLLRHCPGDVNRRTSQGGKKPPTTSMACSSAALHASSKMLHCRVGGQHWSLPCLRRSATVHPRSVTNQNTSREMDGHHDIDDAGGRMEYLMLGAARNRVLSEIRIVVRCNVARHKRRSNPSRLARDGISPNQP